MLCSVSNHHLLMLQNCDPVEFHEFGCRGNGSAMASTLLHGLLQNMDLIITVDSMSAHLAGALGLPVWTLLQIEADWRWMENRTDSPWYPTMKLFRQTVQGEWEPVICEVKQALKNFIAHCHLNVE